MVRSTAARNRQRGKELEREIRDLIKLKFPEIDPDDIRTAIGIGETGCDIKLSKKAKSIFPWSVEAKRRKTHAIYPLWEQTVSNVEEGTMPLLVIRQDRDEPLAVIKFETFLDLVAKIYKNGLY